jgi:light-regulated signal transduction histidine kinase (bacteriophytochrome)
MYQQITRVLDAERTRDGAMMALRASEAEQRRLAEDLAEMNRQLERRVAERTAELAVANRHLEAFSYSVSHDLRAPLRAIAGFARILTEDFGDRLDVEAHGHLGRIVAGTQRLSELIEGMLTLGRVVKADLHRIPIDITALAFETEREVGDGDPARSVEWVVHPGMRAMGDPSLVRAVLSNLLANAFKFTSKTSRARVEVGQRGEDAGRPVFFVCDNGAGFDMRHAEKLFRAFTRLHAQSESPGTGVGLATVERIVSRHGGRIWAEGKPGAGATFYFTLSGEGLGRPD